MGASAGGGSVARMIELLMPASTAKVVPMTPKLSNGERDLAARHSRTRPLSASSGRNQLARAVAFGQREKVVLPLPVRVGAQIRGFVAIAADHADIHFLACGAVDRVIGPRGSLQNRPTDRGQDMKLFYLAGASLSKCFPQSRSEA